MFDPGVNDMVPPPSSPTISSVSSSDLDTESTGSFFHDRSTTLGTLMGVNFPTLTFRTPAHNSHPRVDSAATSAATVTMASRRERRKKKKRVVVSAERRTTTRWWSLCRDEDDAKPGCSLGEYLEVERRFGDVAFYETTEVEMEGQGNGNGRVLFADGRVLPPVGVGQVVEESPSTAGVVCRFPALTGICSGGD